MKDEPYYDHGWWDGYRGHNKNQALSSYESYIAGYYDGDRQRSEEYEASRVLSRNQAVDE